MRLHNLLLEYDTNITAQKQGPALTARWLEDSSAKRDVDGHSAQKPEDILEFLEYADPTKNKQYMMWVIKEYLAKNFMFEDIEGLKGELELYHTMKPRLPVEHRDIGRYNLFSFREMMSEYEGSGGDFELASEVSKEDVDILVNSPQGVLARAKTEKGACEMGKGTKWCTASTDGGNYADSYIDGSTALEQPYGDGLFIYWEYPGKKKYQLHFGNSDYDGDPNWGDEPLPSITVMDAQDQTVFDNEPDWLINRQTNPVLGGLIKAMQDYYIKELKMVDMFDDNDREEDDFYSDDPYYTFFSSWRMLFGKGKHSAIEAQILEELPHVTKMDVEKRKAGNYYRGLEHAFLDVNRFKFALEYISNLRGQPWPQIEKMIILELNKISYILSSDEKVHNGFVTSMTSNFVRFREDLDSYVKRGILTKTVIDAFDKNFADKFTNPLLLKNPTSDVIDSINVMWGEKYFSNVTSKQKLGGSYGLDIQSIPKQPPVQLQQMPAIELLKHVELHNLFSGFDMKYKSVFASKGIFNREANLFDRMRYSVAQLYDLTIQMSRDLPGVAFYDDVRNSSTTKQEDTKNGPLLIELEEKLSQAGLSEDQIKNFVGTPATGFGRSWAWGELDPSLIFQGLFDTRSKELETMDASEYQLVKSVYEILSPYMYDLDENLYDAIVSNLRSSPLGKLNNAILNKMFDEILELKQSRGSLHGIFKTTSSRCLVAGELFANQAGQPVQFDDQGKKITNARPKSDDENQLHSSLDYIRRLIIQKAPGYQDLKLIAPDLNDPKTKKVYVDISKQVADMSFTEADNYEFDRDRTQADIERFDDLYRSFKPLSSTSNDLQGG